jgi:hypothetical protein
MKSAAQIETLMKLMIQLEELLKDFTELSKKKLVTRQFHE